MVRVSQKVLGSNPSWILNIFRIFNNDLALKLVDYIVSSIRLLNNFHVQEGYCSCLCLFVCLSVCLLSHISPLEYLFILKILSHTQWATEAKKFLGFSLKAQHSLHWMAICTVGYFPAKSMHAHCSICHVVAQARHIQHAKHVTLNSALISRPGQLSHQDAKVESESTSYLTA